MVDLPTEDNPAAVVEGDCLEVLADLPAGAVGAVVTDPPYGINLSSHGTIFRGMTAIAGDETQAVGQATIDWCVRRRWPVAAFASPMRRWAGVWRQELVWDKGGAVGIGGDRATCWKFTWELIQVGGFAEVFGPRDEAVLRFPVTPANYRHHPAAKPVELMRYLVRKLSRPGDLILDPFCGSGTTLVAAVLEGRRAVGVEISPAYCEIARRRVAAAVGGGLVAGLAHGGGS